MRLRTAYIHYQKLPWISLNDLLVLCKHQTCMPQTTFLYIGLLLEVVGLYQYTWSSKVEMARACDFERYESAQTSVVNNLLNLNQALIMINCESLTPDSMINC
jgi:hypothetical protein